MSPQKQRFVDAYVHCLNGAKAAVQAGYSAKSAKQTANRLLKEPEIRETLQERLTEVHMSWQEAARRIANTAATRLNDFFIDETVVESRMTRVPLQELIDTLELEFKIEEEFFDQLTQGMPRQSSLDDDKDGDDKKKLSSLEDEHFLAQQERKSTILRYKIELKYNPQAFRDIPQNRVVTKVGIDLLALKESEELGAVKKLSFNERGLPSVEMYPADRAQEIILKMNNKLVERHDHTTNGHSFLDFLQSTDPVNGDNPHES